MIRKVRPGHEEIRLDRTAQSVRNEETLRDRSGRLDNINSQEEARPQQFVIGNDEAALVLSVESRSFVNRVNDQVRTRQKRISNVTENGEKHSMIWGMFMAVTMESPVFMGENHQNTCHSIANTTHLTLKQMFDIYTKLVSEQDEISGLETIGWENLSWKYLSLIGDERIINLQRTKVYVFSDSVLCFGKIFEILNLTMHGSKDWDGSNLLKITETLTESTVSRWNSSGIFPRIQYFAAQRRSQKFTVQIGRNTGNFHRKNSMSMFNDISCGTKDNEKECLANAQLVSLYAIRLGKGQLSFIGPGSEKKWSSIKEDSPQGIWDNIAEWMLLEFAESGCPIFRATTPLSRGQLKSKGHGKLSIHYAADQETIQTIFSMIVSANQLSLYGAVAEMCEEYESLHERTVRPVLMVQSIVLSAIKTEVPLDADLFTIGLRNDDIQEFDSKWDGILSMTEIHLMTSWKDCSN